MERRRKRTSVFRGGGIVGIEQCTVAVLIGWLGGLHPVPPAVPLLNTDDRIINSQEAHGTLSVSQR